MINENIDFAEVFWDKVREMLAYYGWSIKKLACLSKVKASTISKGLNNNHMPSVETAVKISSALEFSLNDIFGVKVQSDNDKKEEKKDLYDINTIRMKERLKGKFDELPELSKNMIVCCIEALWKENEKKKKSVNP